MMTISKSELVTAIRSTKGTTFATLTCNTDAKLKKTGNPYKDVRKITTMNVCIGFDYQNSVNNQRNREDIEGDFLSAPRQWGKRVDLKTVEHNGKTYLTTKVEKTFEVKYMAGDLEIQKASIQAFLPAKSKSATQKTSKEIIYRDITIENIKSITMKGETFLVV